MMSYRIVLSEQNQGHDSLMDQPIKAYELVSMSNEQSAKDSEKN